MIEFLLWYLTISLVGLLALPVAFRFFPNLSDRGYTLARALGLLLWGFAFWLLASLHILQNDIGGVLAAFVLFIGFSLWASRGLRGWRELSSWLKSRVRLVVIAEILFLLAFAFLAVLRAAGPQISGTEKPMELAFINSILRSPSFPPADPWLSGYSISYYYFGYVLVAMLVRITGVSVGIAFNLMIAMVFALAALGSYGIVNTLLASWSRRRQEEGRSGIFSQGWALLAPLFILILSNLEGGFEVLHAGGLFWQDNGLAKRSEVWNWIGLQELNQPPSEPFTWVPNRSGGIWWWRASRVVQDFSMTTGMRQAIPGIPFSSYLAPAASEGGPIEVIDEFPFFSYYLADLHPHVLAMPFVMLAIALALNLFLRGSHAAFDGGGLKVWIGQVDFWLTALVLGSLAFFNTWDFPIYVGLYSATYTLVRYQQAGWIWWDRIKEFVLRSIVLGIAGILLYFPFFAGFSSQAGGIIPSLSFFTRGLHFWIMFGTLLTPIVFWMFWLARRQGKNHNFSTGLRLAVYVLGGLWLGSYLLGILGLNLSALGGLVSNSQNSLMARLASSLTTWGAAFINLQGSQVADIFWGSMVRRLTLPGTWLSLFFLLAGTWALIASFRAQPEETESEIDADDKNLAGEPVPAGAAHEEGSEIVSPAEGVETRDFLANPELGNPNAFVLLLVLMGIGLTLAPEFIYLRDQFGGRMNTIFKFYFQTWMLWGVAGAFAFTLLWKELYGSLAWVGRILGALVFTVGLIYPAFGISQRLNFADAKNWTLDGNAYIGQYDPHEQAAMAWLRNAAYGYLVEAVGGSYGPAARMATQTGLPNLLGWPGHESQWRGGAVEMGSRQDDINTLYRTRDWNEARSILQRYQVRYVVVGQLEWNLYRADDQKGLRGLDDQKFQKNLKTAYQNNGVTIYEVNQLAQPEK